MGTLVSIFKERTTDSPNANLDIDEFLKEEMVREFRNCIYRMTPDEMVSVQERDGLITYSIVAKFLTGEHKDFMIP